MVEGHVCRTHHSRQFHLGRRSLLLTGGAAMATAFAGCVGGGGMDDGAVPDPVAIGAGVQCDACGMVIGNHPGPSGELFYRDRSPADHDNPAWFDGLKSCLFPYYFEKDRLDWSLAVGYVTDYSTVEYTVQSEGSDRYISSHTDAASFAEMSALTYVVDSVVQGAMGPDFVPFSDPADADAFAAEYGGDVIAFEDIEPSLLSG